VNPDIARDYLIVTIRWICSLEREVLDVVASGIELRDPPSDPGRIP
jgi:hypothetical protein